jgi:uncharacterized membrane protein
MSRVRIDAQGWLAIMAVIATALAAYAPRFLAIPAGLALVFVLPGLGLVRLLFRRRMLSSVERFMLVVGLSLATVIIGGILLNAVRIPLHRGAWAALTGGVTIIAAGLVYLRQARASRGGWATEDTAEFGTVLNASTEKVPVPRAILRLAPLVLAVVLVAGAGYTALRAAQQNSSNAFTELGISPSGDPSLAPSATPSASVAVGVRAVTLNVVCSESEATSYTIRVQGPNGFAKILTATLEPGASWSVSVTVPYPGKVTADLFKGGITSSSTPYRTVFLTDTQ